MVPGGWVNLDGRTAEAKGVLLAGLEGLGRDFRVHSALAPRLPNTMAVGFTINHIAAVVLPVIGGILWMVDYRIPFVVGAAFSIVSLIAVQRIRVPG